MGKGKALDSGFEQKPDQSKETAAEKLLHGIYDGGKDKIAKVEDPRTEIFKANDAARAAELYERISRNLGDPEFRDMVVNTLRTSIG
jgi:hypothetical protein